MHICDVSKPSANVWNIFQASTGDFLVTSGGGWRNVKFTCEGAKQCIFVMFPSPQPMYVRVPNTGFFFGGIFAMFPSPQHMFEIYFRLVLVIFGYKRGWEF